MTREESLERLAQFGAQGDAAFPLLETAIALALHERPGRDPEPVRRLVEAAAEQVRPRLGRADAPAAFGEVLAGAFGLMGDAATYDDAANGDILEVCRRRKGLPVALGLLYLSVARAAGCDRLVGTESPGHFLLLWSDGPREVSLDPFSGGLPAPGAPASALAPVSDRAVAIRLENNALTRAAAAGDHPRAERSALRLTRIAPGDPRPWIALARAREGQGLLAGALEALEASQRLGAPADAAAGRRMRLQIN